MKSNVLLKVAIVISLIGIVLLFLISENIELDESSLDKITLQDQGDYVKVQGMVTKVVDTEKVAILEIEQPAQKTVILFKQSKEKTTIQQGQQVEILGTVDEYEGKPEIIAHRVRVI